MALVVPVWPERRCTYHVYREKRKRILSGHRATRNSEALTSNGIAWRSGVEKRAPMRL
jgi:hypothetical protein